MSTMGVWRGLVIGLCGVVMAMGVAMAAEPAKQARPMAEDPAVEARLVSIAEELRCLVCQN